jgi:hypothetical protein
MRVGCGDGTLGDQVVPNYVESFADWELVGDILLVLCCCCLGNQSRFLVSFSPLDVRPLKAAYNW